MRSQREEYAKRFEELTKQEIKNYNDSLLATHVALEGFRTKLKNCVDLYAQQVAKISSQINEVQAENRDIKESIRILKKKLDSQVNDFNKFERESLEKDRLNSDFKNSIKKEICSQSVSIQKSNSAVDEIKFMVERQIDDIFLEITNTYRKTVSDNMKVKEEILSLPSEAEKVKTELEDKILSSAIDNAGIIKELEKVKKSAFIQHKMNEYFHTQLDRLKGKTKDTRNTEVLRG